MKRKSILLALISIFMFPSSFMSGMKVGSIEIQRQHVPAIAAAVTGGAFFLGMNYYLCRDHEDWNTDLREHVKLHFPDICKGTIVAAVFGGGVGWAANKTASLYQKYGSKIFTVPMIFFAGYFSRRG